MSTSHVQVSCFISRTLYDCSHCMQYIEHGEGCGHDAEPCEVREVSYSMKSSECPRCHYAYHHQTNFDEITVAGLGMCEDVTTFHANDTALYLPHKMIAERKALFRMLIVAAEKVLEVEQQIVELGEQARRLRTQLRDAYLLNRLATTFAYVVGQGTEQQCNICLDEYQRGDEPCRLPCGHEFGFSCIVQWLLDRGTCPQCRQAFL